MKLLRLFALCGLWIWSACNYKPVSVSLRPVNGLFPIGETWHTPTIEEADSSDLSFARGIDADTFSFYSFSHRPVEHAYYQRNNSKADSLRYSELLRRRGIATDFVLPSTPSDANTRICFGRRKNGDFFIVVDENNNNQLTDDSIRWVQPVRNKKQLDKALLPSFTVNNLQGFGNGVLFSFSTSFSIQPNITEVSQSMLLRPQIRSSGLSEGLFKFRGKTYKLRLRNTQLPIRNFQPQFLYWYVEDLANPMSFATTAEASIYQLGDTAVLQDRFFHLVRLSAFADSALITPVRLSDKTNKPKPVNRLTEKFSIAKDPTGEAFPTFAHVQESGNYHTDSLRGKVVMINFWFEACAPCVAEFTALEQLYQRLKHRNDFRFLSFTFESPEVVERVRQKWGIQFPVLSVSRQECHRLNFNSGFPVNAILDRMGVIRFFHIGGATESEKAKAFVFSELLPAINKELEQ